MPKKKTSKNDTKRSKGKSVNKRKKSKEIVVEPEKIEIPKRPRIIREKTELIHDNPSQANEGIVKTIIDKIITLSVRYSLLNSIDRQLDDYYFDYMKIQVNTLFAANNIFYYDEPEIKQINKKELFWNKRYEKGNTWIEISEPNTSKCDRYENAFMNYVNFTYKSSAKLPAVSGVSGPTLNRANTVQEVGNAKIKDDMKISASYNKKISMKILGVKNKEVNQKVLDTLEEKSSLSSLDEESKDLKGVSNKSKNNIKNKPTFKNSLKNTQSLFANENTRKIISNNNINNTKDNNINNKRPKKEPIPEMVHKEIPGIEKEYNHEKYDPPDINFLRKERQEEILKKEIEERKNARNKKIINNSQIDNNKNMDTFNTFIDTHTKLKMFDSNKYSFDSNGKIINFKPIKMDALIKDFVSIKNGIKSFDNVVKVRKFVKKKNTSPNKNDDSSNKNKTLTKREKIIKNPEDDPNGINKHNYVKINTDKNEHIIPSGSNFSIMLPNIGVILKEDEQIKEGTREFGKYFKKYSLNDYDKILRDFVPLQNKTMLKNKMNQSMNNINLNMSTAKKIPKKFMSITNNSFKMNTNNNSSIGNNVLLKSQSQNFSQVNSNIFNNADISNPLINQADTIQENEYNANNDLNLNNLNSINNSSLLLKSIKSNKNQSYNHSFLNSTPFSLMRNGSCDNLSSGFIKLNKNGTSLKNELDTLKDLDEKTNTNFYPPPDKTEINSKNIFLNNYKEIFKEKEKEKIKKPATKNNFNEFNKKIILTKGWGIKTMSKNMSTGNLLVSSKHHTRYQALRELGSNLLNGIKVKLPRDRKVDINI